ncbi:beta-class carbonic anhydrase [Tepidibacter formicigenes]|jgi:carbonic anhydrase|uniref:carbonic anhydrase n=1 Tax=Tepidibacter formicigenes DSM 15518 TaxID=1123349 RepID=A0A1M6PV67_9FIRM|nr:carbonic anhydrase [Tepidibacter formicigenes]SHK11831.1 carbonic anhydrase [Tepidibacter formicigenes DSM 15518]
MSKLQEILEYNKLFVENKKYEKYKATKYPDKKIVILSCMDTRLTELLLPALNLKNGDAKVVKNAGAVITHPYGSIMRSILVAVYELNAEEVFVIGHHGCGVSSLNVKDMIEKIIKRGISKDIIYNLEDTEVDLKKWFQGFDCVGDSVKESVSIIKNHPLIPKDIFVHGLVIDPETGELEVVVDGYK